MQTKQFQAIIEQDEDGFFVAEIPGIKACYAQGKSFEEAMTNIKDVLQMCLDEMRSRGEPIPEQSEIIGVKRVEAAI